MSSEPHSSQGLQLVRKTQDFSPGSQSPLFPHPSITVQGTHHLNIAGQMPRCSCSSGIVLNNSHSQTMPSAKSSKPTLWSVDLSPKPKLDPGKSSGSCTPSPGSPVLSDSAPPSDSNTCVAVAGPALNPWRPGPQREWIPHSTRSLLWTRSVEASLHLSLLLSHLLQLQKFCSIDLVLVLSICSICIYLSIYISTYMLFH